MTEAANKLTRSAALPMKAVTGRCKGGAAGATPLEGEVVAHRTEEKNGYGLARWFIPDQPQ